ncbi:hypothetical protein [Roseivirga pacifica]|uniref:hypothetical protein n=1 Tax=Roseivirga pacifica TaxID=1267423 RepID=UPI003BB1E349
MRKTFTYIFASLLFVACVFNEQLLPDNLSYSMLGSVKRNLDKEKSELIEDMKVVLTSGLFSIEVYSTSGELVRTITQPDQITSEFKQYFASDDFKIKTIQNQPLMLKTALY